MTEARATGTIKCFFDGKGYGWIIPDDGGEDVMFHVTDFLDDRSLVATGRKVSYRPYAARKGPRAVDVTVLTEDGKCPLCGAEKAR